MLPDSLLPVLIIMAPLAWLCLAGVEEGKRRKHGKWKVIRELFRTLYACMARRALRKQHTSATFTPTACLCSCAAWPPGCPSHFCMRSGLQGPAQGRSRKLGPPSGQSSPRMASRRCPKSKRARTSSSRFGGGFVLATRQAQFKPLRQLGIVLGIWYRLGGMHSHTAVWCAPLAAASHVHA